MTTIIRYRPDNFTIRDAVPDDAPVILELIRGLAEYERLADEVVADVPLLRKWIFDERKAEVVLGVAGGDIVGFALFFTNFSTFLGRPGIYLEDLFVIPKARGNGYGTLLLQHLAKLVVDRGYGRLEWACLDWNRPSIAFYLSLGAVPMDDWTVYRLAGDALRTLAEEEDGDEDADEE